MGSIISGLMEQGKPGILSRTELNARDVGWPGQTAYPAPNRPVLDFADRLM
jgi:hypothetical protein